MLRVGVDATGVQHDQALKLGVREVDGTPAFPAEIPTQLVATFGVAVLVTFDLVLARQKGQLGLEYSKVVRKG